MSERYTRRDAEAALGRLATAAGRPWTTGSPWMRRDDGKTVALVGVWYLDYAPLYGGYVVHEMANEAGGVSEPFGSRRRTAREFCEAVDFAVRAIQLVTL